MSKLGYVRFLISIMLIDTAIVIVFISAFFLLDLWMNTLAILSPSDLWFTVSSSLMKAIFAYSMVCFSALLTSQVKEFVAHLRRRYSNRRSSYGD